MGEVASTLTRNRRIDEGFDSYNRKNLHIFAGLIRCGECGSRMTDQHDRERGDGWRPSLYFRSNRRRFTTCTNKSATDVSLGLFVFNFLANMIKAAKSFGVTTGVETLEKKLMRGAVRSGAHRGRGLGKCSTSCAGQKSLTRLVRIPLARPRFYDCQKQRISLVQQGLAAQTVSTISPKRAATALLKRFSRLSARALRRIRRHWRKNRAHSFCQFIMPTTAK